MSRPFVSTRDRRFHHAGDAINFIERTNCAKGCTIPTDDAHGPAELGSGPGGNCPLLAQVASGDEEPIPALTDGGSWIRCEKRIPPEEERPQVETLFDSTGDLA